MHFSDDDLRSALGRKDPGERFSEQVLAKISGEAAAKPAQRRPWRNRGFMIHKLVPAGVFLVLAVAAWEGFVQYRRAEQRRAGEVAERQAIFALRMTTAQLHYVFARVQADGRGQTSPGGRNDEN
jgi:hypothetical protein